MSSHISSQALTLLRDLQKLDKACQGCAEDGPNQAHHHAQTLFPQLWWLPASLLLPPPSFGNSSGKDLYAYSVLVQCPT